jgi:hypothetical protein
VKFDLFITCSIVAVSRCMYVSAGNSIDVGTGLFLLYLEYPLVSVYRRSSDLLVVII